MKLLLVSSSVIAALICYFLWRYFLKKQFAVSHVVITGGSSGIGKALAEEFCSKNVGKICVIARDGERLESTVASLRHYSNRISSPCEITYLKCDITGKSEVLSEIFSNYIRKEGPIDVLVNCAGFAIARKFIDTEAVEFDRLLQVNVLGSVKITKCLLPHMIERRRDGYDGYLNLSFISSIAGQIGIFGYTGYSASKFALRGLTDALRLELQPHDINVCLAFPPDTDTPGYQTENIGKPEESKAISAAAGLHSPRRVAAGICSDILNGVDYSSFGFDGWLTTAATAGFTVPRSVGHAVVEIATAGVVRGIAHCFSLWIRYVVWNCARKKET